MERLKLLNSPDPVLPLDPQNIRPFELSFTKNTLCLSFNGKLVAYASQELDETRKGFTLNVMARENIFLDQALRKTFEKLTKHLNQVQRIINADKQQEKIRRDAETEAMRESLMTRCREVFEKISPLMLRGEQNDFTASSEEMIAAQLCRAQDDVIDVVHQNGLFSIRLMNIGSGFINTPLFMENEAQLKISTFGYLGIENTNIINLIKEVSPDMVLDAAMISQQIKRMAERNLRITDVERVMSAMRNIQETEYDAVRFFMSGLSLIPKRSASVDIGDGYSCMANAGGIHLLSEGCEVFFLSVRPIEDRDETNLKHCFYAPSGKMRQVFNDLSDDDMKRICGAWVGLLQGACPELDFEVCKNVDEEALLRATEMMDMGY